MSCLSKGYPDKSGIIKKPDFPCGAVDKNLPANAGDTGWIPGPGRSHMQGVGATTEPERCRC